jgi:phosphatidate cytidylyltransferase
MLKQRIITALALLAVLLPAVFYSNPYAFALVATVLIGAGAWEWAQLNQVGSVTSRIIGFFCACLCLASWHFGLQYDLTRSLWIGVGSFWVAFGSWLLMRSGVAWLAVPRALRLVGGVLALWAAWLAVVQARLIGINFLFSVLVLVWAADVFAYFAGKGFGGKLFRNKLAPSISPGKTWEGVVGGMTGVLVCAFVWRWVDGQILLDSTSLYTRLSANGWAFMLLAVVFLAAMSVVGDLVESLFKRAAGVKDSSGLLPGHGGVLDRVDALLPILPLSMMLVSI